MITFICVLFAPKPPMPSYSAGVYSPVWVDRLYRGIQRNVAETFRFVCLTDWNKHHFVEDVETYDFLVDHGTWTNINEIFRPDLGIEHGFFLNLDVVITGDLGPLMAIKPDFAMLRHPYPEPGKTLYNAIAMFSAAGADVMWHLYQKSKPEDWPLMNGCPSEMLWWEKVAPHVDIIDDHCPGHVAMFGRRDHMPKDPRIVHMKGKTKNADLATHKNGKWLHDLWIG